MGFRAVIVGSSELRGSTRRSATARCAVQRRILHRSRLKPRNSARWHRPSRRRCDSFLPRSSQGIILRWNRRSGCSIRGRVEARKVENRSGRVHTQRSARGMELNKKCETKQGLGIESSDHNCVLFVQHLSKNGRPSPVRSGSFVACAEVFGNCVDATEGGIPRSSR